MSFVHSIRKPLGILALGAALVTGAAAQPTDATAGFLQIVAISPTAQAAESLAGARWSIFLDGTIDEGAADRLAGWLAKRDVTNAAVYLNSPGGSLIGAMALGRLFRRNGFATVVAARSARDGSIVAGVCYSACPFAFAGGVPRALEAGSVLGVHRAENRVPVPDAADFRQRVTNDTRFYFAEMGIDERLVGILAQVPYDAIRVLSPDEAAQLKLVTVR